MQADTKPTRLVVNEYEAAVALDLSVHTLRKDRTGARQIPFFKVGGCVRYNLERVREALDAYEVGGPATRGARRPSMKGGRP